MSVDCFTSVSNLLPDSSFKGDFGRRQSFANEEDRSRRTANVRGGATHCCEVIAVGCPKGHRCDSTVFARQITNLTRLWQVRVARGHLASLEGV